jgi:phosphatidylglycerophosphate synthase
MNVWRGRLHRWFEPLARRCPLSPNSITVIALAVNVAAAVLLARQQFLLAMLLLIVGGLADAFDGIVARVQEKSSPFGDFLDHFADRVSDTQLVAGWVLGNNVRVEIAMAVVLAVMLNGYSGTQIEATWRERNYDTVGRGEFLVGMVIFPIVSHILLQNGWDRVTAATLTVAEWMTVLLIFGAVAGIAQRFALALRLSR